MLLVEGILNVNGFDATPIAGGGSAITDGSKIMPIDVIQEFNLMENPKAEYGGKPGAVVNVGIRSGTNGFHGSAYAFDRDGTWDARNVFNPAPNPLLPLDLEQFGGVLGGPIIKDKLFFFGGYEGLHDLLGNAFVTVMTPTAYRYRLQVRDKFTYLDDAFEIGFLVNALLDSSREGGGSFVKDRFAGPVRLSNISITLSTIEPAAVERVWYSSETNGK